MAKAGGKQFKSIRLERLARFIEWATARYPMKWTPPSYGISAPDWRC